jgi:hypothetical protein
VKSIICRKLAHHKQRLERQLDKNDNRSGHRPMMTACIIDYDIADRSRGLAHGEIGAMHLLARRIRKPMERI